MMPALERCPELNLPSINTSFRGRQCHPQYCHQKPLAAHERIKSINDLPRHILLQIFFWLRNADHSGCGRWMTIVRVCSRWRAIAISTPGLWSNLYLNGNLDGQAVDTLLSRTRGGRIRLGLNGNTIGVGYLDAVLPNLWVYRAFYTSIYATCIQGTHIQPLQQLLHSGLSFLQWLDLSAPRGSNLRTLCLLSIRTANLRWLSLRSITVFVEGSLLHLTRLDLYDMAVERKYEAPDFYDLLLACPNLEQLILDNSIPELPHAWHSTELRLPLSSTLSCLHVRDKGFRLHEFCHQVSIGHVKEIDLSIELRGTYESWPVGPILSGIEPIAPSEFLHDLPFPGGSSFLPDLLSGHDADERLRETVKESVWAIIVCGSSRTTVHLQGSKEPLPTCSTWTIRVYNCDFSFDPVVQSLIDHGPSFFSAATLTTLQIHLSVRTGPVFEETDWESWLRALPNLTVLHVGTIPTSLMLLCALATHVPRLEHLDLCFRVVAQSSLPLQPGNVFPFLKAAMQARQAGGISCSLANLITRFAEHSDTRTGIHASRWINPGEGQDQWARSVAVLWECVHCD